MIDMALAGEVLPREPQGAGRYIDRATFEALKRVQPGESSASIERRIRAFWYPPHAGAVVALDGTDYTLVSDTILEELAERERTTAAYVRAGKKGRSPVE